jgi:hypothetical protein
MGINTKVCFNLICFSHITLGTWKEEFGSDRDIWYGREAGMAFCKSDFCLIKKALKPLFFFKKKIKNCCLFAMAGLSTSLSSQTRFALSDLKPSSHQRHSIAL